MPKKVQIRASGQRKNDNGEHYTRFVEKKFDWGKVWAGVAGSVIAFLIIAFLSGNLKITTESEAAPNLSGNCNLGSENKHKIEMLQQEVKLKLEPMEERLGRIEKSIEKIVDKLDAR